MPLVEELGIHLVDVVVRGEHGRSLVEVFLDTDTGISTERCAEVSRLLSPIIDTYEGLRGSYTLVVSSPGLDRPLKHPWQFSRNIGRVLQIKYAEPPETRTIDGELLAVDEAKVTIQENGADIKIIELADVIDAKICLPW